MYLNSGVCSTLSAPFVTKEYQCSIISHNIQDVMQVSDRIVVMRRGLKVGELVTRDTDLNEVVSLIVGGSGGEPATAPETPNERGAPSVNSMSERSETRQADSLSTAERRAYRQLCNGSGRMLVIACDQRNAMRAALAETAEERAAISNAQLGEVKADLVRYLGNHAPSVLLDPECALPAVVDEDVLARDVGLLVAMDASGWQTKPESPLRYSAVIRGIDAEAVRRIGGTAAKMLVYMRPDHEGPDSHAVDLIRSLVADCRAQDLLLVVEILTYQLAGESDDEYEQKKPDLDPSRGCTLCFRRCEGPQAPVPGLSRGVSRRDGGCRGGPVGGALSRGRPHHVLGPTARRPRKWCLWCYRWPLIVEGCGLTGPRRTSRPARAPGAPEAAGGPGADGRGAQVMPPVLQSQA